MFVTHVNHPEVVRTIFLKQGKTNRPSELSINSVTNALSHIETILRYQVAKYASKMNCRVM